MSVQPKATGMSKNNPRRIWVLGLTALAGVAAASAVAFSAAGEQTEPAPRYSALDGRAVPLSETFSRYADFIDISSARLVRESANGRYFLARGVNDGELCQIAELPDGAAGVGCFAEASDRGGLLYTANAPNSPNGVFFAAVPDGTTEVVLSGGRRSDVEQNAAVFEKTSELPDSVELVSATGSRVQDFAAGGRTFP